MKKLFSYGKTTRRLLPAALGLFAVPALAVSSLAMLETLDRGGWQLRYRDGSGIGQVCVQSGRELIQLRHRVGGCQSVVLTDEASEVTVQYTCAGRGYGRTNIRKETHGLVQISSQGVADGKPFQVVAEARRVGACNK